MAADPTTKSFTIKRNELKSFVLSNITTPGTYTFTITETEGSTPGMTYDVDEEGNPVAHEVVIAVTEDPDTGKLLFHFAFAKVVFQTYSWF